MVFDQPERNRSSAIAAGLFNPITGKLMSKTWQADLLFPELDFFYRHAEQILDQRFYYPQWIYRPFLSVEEQNAWMGKSSDAAWMPYIKNIYSQSVFTHQVNNPWGGIVLNQCGYVDVLKFMKSISDYLTKSNSIVFEQFDESLIQHLPNGISYKDFQATKIIFCTGTETLNSSLGSRLPIRRLKGETLTIEMDEKPELIYNRGVYIVPYREKQFRVGATYETKNLSCEITEEGRMELDQKLKELISIPYRVTNQDWGFRPTTPDRRPILGPMPDSENVIIFNGLGTKGVSLAPYFSAQLCNWLLEEGKIQPEVNIVRFKSLSSKSSVAV
jgi:hypothetical protein